MTTTHVAGPMVSKGSEWAIQRCCVCGELLVDSRGMMAPVGPNGEPPATPEYPQGALVRETRLDEFVVGWTVIGPYHGPDPLPSDFCLPPIEGE